MLKSNMDTRATRREVLKFTTLTALMPISGCSRDIENKGNSRTTTTMQEAPIEIQAENETDDDVTLILSIYSNGEQVSESVIDIPSREENVTSSHISETGAYRLIAKTENLSDELVFRVDEFQIEQEAAITITVLADKIRSGIQE